MRITEPAKSKLPERLHVTEFHALIKTGEISWPGNNPARSKSSPSTGARASPEEDLHRLCFQLIEALEPKYPILAYMTHAPNGGARSKGEAGKLKAMGVRPGFPDFVLPRRRGAWSGLALELKSPIGKMTTEQKFWLAGLEDEGYLCSVCRSLESFETLLMGYLNGGLNVGVIERGWVQK